MAFDLFNNWDNDSSFFPDNYQDNFDDLNNFFDTLGEEESMIHGPNQVHRCSSSHLVKNMDNDLSILRDIYQDDLDNLASILSPEESAMIEVNPVQVPYHTECPSWNSVPGDPTQPQSFTADPQTCPDPQSVRETDWLVNDASFTELMTLNSAPPSSDPVSASEPCRSESTTELSGPDQGSPCQKQVIEVLLWDGHGAVPSPQTITLYGAQSEPSSPTLSQPTSPEDAGLPRKQKRRPYIRRPSSSSQGSQCGPVDKHRKVEQKYRDGLKKALEELNLLMGGDPSLTKLEIIQLATEHVRQIKQANELPQRTHR